MMGRYDGYFYTRDGKLEFQKDRAIRAMELLKEHLKYTPGNVLGLSIDEANAVFFNGKAAIMECWPSFTRAAANDPSKSKVVGKWAFMPYPAPGLDYLSLWLAYVSKYSKYPDTSWEWIKAYVNPVNSKRFFEKYGIGPVHAAVYEDAELKEKYKHDFPATLANLQRAARPPLPPEAEWFLDQMTAEFLAGRKTAGQAVDAVNEKFASLGPQAALFDMARRQGLVEK